MKKIIVILLLGGFVLSCGPRRLRCGPNRCEIDNKNNSKNNTNEKNTVQYSNYRFS